MTVTGDFADLEALIRRLEKLPEKKRELFEVLAEDARSRVDESFTRSSSPEREPWLPLARPRRRGPGKPLLDTGRLRASIHCRVTADGFVLLSPTVYAATHQYGRGAIPARPFFPTHGLPPVWAASFREQADLIVRAHFE